MKIYKCEKCGSTDIFIECNENHRGLYCGDCGKWIKWLNKDEERLASRQIIESKNEEKIRAEAMTEFAEWLEENGYKYIEHNIWEALEDYEKEKNNG